MYGNLLQITDTCRDISLGLTYDKIHEAINNCSKEKRERLIHIARDLEIKTGWDFQGWLAKITKLVYII